MGMWDSTGGNAGQPFWECWAVQAGMSGSPVGKIRQPGWECGAVQVCLAHPGSTPAFRRLQEKLGELEEARQRLEVCESRSSRLELQRRTLEAELGRIRRALAERDAEAREARERAEQLRKQVPAPIPANSSS